MADVTNLPLQAGYTASPQALPLASGSAQFQTLGRDNDGLSFNQPSKVNGQSAGARWMSDFFGSRSGSSGDVISPPPSMLEDALRGSRSNAIDNSYLSQQFAREQMDFQAASQLAAMEFNSKEAAKNRDWQMYMSNTAHQREVRDLLAAGLNPILSAMGGNGATTGTGATASSQAMSGASGSVDTSGNQAVASLVATALQAENQYEMNKVNAITNLAIAEADRKNKRDLQESANANAWKIAELTAETSRYGTDVGENIAKIYAAAQMYGAQMSAGAIMGSAGIAAGSAQAINAANIANERYMAEMYPSTLPQIVPRVIAGVTGGSSVGQVASDVWDWITGSAGSSSKSSDYGGKGRKF